MPRLDLNVRLERLAAEIAQLEGLLAQGASAPGLKGRLRFLKRREAWYRARQYGLRSGGRTFSLRQPKHGPPPTVPEDLILDVRALL